MSDPNAAMLRRMRCVALLSSLFISACGGVSSRPTTLVASETEAVLNIVERYFGPRIFTAPLAWQTFLESIRAIDVPVDSSNRETEIAYCDALADVLSRQGILLSHRFPQEYQRCGSYDDPVALEPSTARTWNDGEYVRIEELQDNDARLLTMAVRFGGPDAAYHDARETVVRAGSEAAFLIDLRGANGADVRGGWTLVQALLDRENVTPLATIAQPLERRLVTIDNPLPNFADWQALVGVAPQRADPELPWRSRFAGITVVVDDACEQACEIVARTLHLYAQAHLAGHAHGRVRLGGFAWSQTVLPTSGFLLEFPAAAMVMHSSPGSVVMRAWTDVVYSSGVDYDYPSVIENERSRLAERSRSAMRCIHFLATPAPSCATFDEISAADFPTSNVFSKIRGWGLHAAPQLTTAIYLYLPAPEAHAYLRECAGIEAPSSLPWNDGTTMVLISWDRIESVTRLAQSPVVARIEFGLDFRVEISPRSVE